jgi:hypothetical protein
MFELTKEELEDWRYHFGTSNREKMGLMIQPFVFTEQGVTMLSSVLRSPKSIQLNISTVRILVKISKLSLLSLIVRRLIIVECRLTVESCYF